MQYVTTILLLTMAGCVKAPSHGDAAHLSKPPMAITGIAACDSYLDSYLACHRAAAVYSPAELPVRYQTMRDSLLRDSTDPNVRPFLNGRCLGLARGLKMSLKGRSCDPTITPAKTP
jgi:hypothetical protein